MLAPQRSSAMKESGNHPSVATPARCSALTSKRRLLVSRFLQSHADKAPPRARCSAGQRSRGTPCSTPATAEVSAGHAANRLKASRDRCSRARASDSMRSRAASVSRLGGTRLRAVGARTCAVRGARARRTARRHPDQQAQLEARGEGHQVRPEGLHVGRAGCGDIQRRARGAGRRLLRARASELLCDLRNTRFLCRPRDDRAVEHDHVVGKLQQGTVSRRTAERRPRQLHVRRRRDGLGRQGRHELPEALLAALTRRAILRRKRGGAALGGAAGDERRGDHRDE